MTRRIIPTFLFLILLVFLVQENDSAQNRRSYTVSPLSVEQGRQYELTIRSATCSLHDLTGADLIAPIGSGINVEVAGAVSDCVMIARIFVSKDAPNGTVVLRIVKNDSLWGLIELPVKGVSRSETPSAPQQTTTVNAGQQEPTIEYGSIADLKGITSIYVYTGMDIGLRNKIVGEITKKLNIRVTERPLEGQVCLLYGASIQTFYAGTTISGTDTSNGAIVDVQPQYRKATYGGGIVLIMKPENVARLVMDFRDSKGDKPPLVTLFERDPSTNFARAFVKAYKEANP